MIQEFSPFFSLKIECSPPAPWIGTSHIFFSSHLGKGKVFSQMLFHRNQKPSLKLSGRFQLFNSFQLSSLDWQPRKIKDFLQRFYYLLEKGSLMHQNSIPVLRKSCYHRNSPVTTSKALRCQKQFKPVSKVWPLMELVLPPCPWPHVLLSLSCWHTR